MKKVVTTPKTKSPAVKRKAIAVVAKSPAKRANKSSPIKNGTAKNGVTDSGTQTRYRNTAIKKLLLNHMCDKVTEYTVV